MEALNLDSRVPSATRDREGDTCDFWMRRVNSLRPPIKFPHSASSGERVIPVYSSSAKLSWLNKTIKSVYVDRRTSLVPSSKSSLFLILFVLLVSNQIIAETSSSTAQETSIRGGSRVPFAEDSIIDSPNDELLLDEREHKSEQISSSDKSRAINSEHPQQTIDSDNYQIHGDNQSANQSNFATTTNKWESSTERLAATKCNSSDECWPQPIDAAGHSIVKRQAVVLQDTKSAEQPEVFADGEQEDDLLEFDLDPASSSLVPAPRSLLNNNNDGDQDQEQGKRMDSSVNQEVAWRRAVEPEGSSASDSLRLATSGRQVSVGQRPSATSADPFRDGSATSSGGNRLAATANDWRNDNNLIELVDDDLFLVKGSGDSLKGAAALVEAGVSLTIGTSNHQPLAAGGLRDDVTPLNWPSRVHRSAASNLNSANELVQTIYFGGFFPWLTDDHQHKSAAQVKPSRRLPSASGSQRSSYPENQQHDQKLEQQKQQPQQRRKQKLKPQQAHDDHGPQPAESRHNHQRARSSNNNHHIAQQQQQSDNVTPLPPSSSSTMLTTAMTTTTTTTTTTNAGGQNGRHQLGKFILPAVRLALDHINTNSSVLGSYKLEIVPRDTQCNATISLKEFFDMVYEEPKKMLLYGDACRVSTDPIAKASYFFDLIQISYADTDPIYTIENYPNFFRVVPSENALSSARIPFIRHFNWTRVGTIYQNLPRYSLPHSKLLTDLERYNIVIKQSVSLPGSVDGLQNRDLGDELRKLKEKDVRIILGNFDEEWGLLLFCEAFREKMTGRKYQWILTGMSEDKLWRHYKAKGSSCTEQELLIAMDGYIVTDITPVTRSQSPTISGMMAHEYSNEYKRRALEMNISIEENKFYGYVYDGIWAIALALHRVDKQLKYYNQLAQAGKVELLPEMDGLTSLLDFDYHKPIWVKLIRAALNRTRFSGVTGTVSFHKNERPGLISFSQFQAFRDMNEVIIGSYDALNDNLDLKVGFPIFWRGPSPPIDYTIERVTPFRINRTLFVIISIFAILGIILAFIFLTINIKFRDQRYIKMSSPYLNNLIIIGCILTYTSVIILGLDSGLTSESNFPYICNARAWVLMAGFTLAFGSMFSKTFRVHSIFTNIKLHKKVIKDYKLFMVVFILLTLDVCILVIWQYFDPFYRDTNNGTSIQDPDNEDVIIVPEMEHCQSKRMTIFLSVTYVYKGLLMAFGCFLAWETRHVSIPALNDSKYIGLSVYNVVIMCVIGAGLSFVLRDQQDASFVIISIFIIFCSTTTLCLVFVPKLIELKQNPKAGDHRVRATLKTFKKNYHEEAMGAVAGCRDIHGNLIGRGYGVNLNERIKVMMDENVKQRTVLKEKTYELEALTYKYRKIQSMVQSGQYYQALNSMAANSTGQNTMPALAPIPSSSITNSTNLATTVMLTAQEPTSFNLQDDKSVAQESSRLSLIKSSSPLTSSVTQITTTTITSSTNNAVDTTADYTSSKLTSNSAGSTDQPPTTKRALVAFECLPDSDKSGVRDQNFYHQNISNQAQGVKGHVHLNDDKKPIVGGPLQVASAGKQHQQQLQQQVPKGVADSSYCSIGADYELGCTRKSQDGLNLFSVFSYTSNADNHQQSRRKKRPTRTEVAENNFNRWSEGPFCTLMVRNKNQMREGVGVKAPGRAQPEGRAQPADFDAGIQQKASLHQSDELHSSCPDLAAKVADGRPAILKHRPIRGPKRQLSQQNDQQNTPRSKALISGRGQFPRTISMIEYLGLSEFDLIARRHDKLLRLNGSESQQRTKVCCCACYGSTTSNNPGGRTKRATGQHPAREFQMQSDGDIAISSSEAFNSGDLMQTSSRVSCSTCCSLASHTYMSHSELPYDEATQSSQSMSSHTLSSQTDSSSMSDHAHHHQQPMSNSQMSCRSTSCIEHEAETSQGTRTAHCQHGAHHLCTSHRNHHHHYQSSTTTSSSSSTSSSPFINNQLQQVGSKAAASEHPLCTSGVLYCGPAARDGGNEAAHIAPTASSASITSGDQPAATTTMTMLNSNKMFVENINDNHNHNDGDDDEQNDFIIKCDVLEKL